MYQENEKGILSIIKQIEKPYGIWCSISMIYANCNVQPAGSAIVMVRETVNARQKGNTEMKHHLKTAIKILLLAVALGIGYYYFRLSPVPVQMRAICARQVS